MRPPLQYHRPGLAAATVLLLLVLPAGFHATGAEAKSPEVLTPREFPSEIAQALKPLLRRYGPDAVNLQGNLLRFAINAGSLLDASAGITGVEDGADGRYLAYRVDTGIVYPTSALSPEERSGRVWTDVLIPSLRHCTRLRIPAAGIRVRISYRHADFAGRVELARMKRRGSLSGETLTFTMSGEDIVAFAHDEFGAEDLLRRTSVFHNGHPTEIRIPAPTAHPTGETGRFVPER